MQNGARRSWKQPKHSPRVHAHLHGLALPTGPPLPPFTSQGCSRGFRAPLTQRRAPGTFPGTPYSAKPSTEPNSAESDPREGLSPLRPSTAPAASGPASQPLAPPRSQAGAGKSPLRRAPRHQHTPRPAPHPEPPTSVPQEPVPAVPPRASSPPGAPQPLSAVTFPWPLQRKAGSPGPGSQEAGTRQCRRGERGWAALKGLGGLARTRGARGHGAGRPTQHGGPPGKPRGKHRGAGVSWSWLGRGPQEARQAAGLGAARALL